MELCWLGLVSRNQKAVVEIVELESVIPWGRNADEYKRMFNLSERTMAGKRVLGVGDGPASFSSEMVGLQCTVVSIDPIYQFSAKEIAARLQEVTPLMEAQLSKHADRYIWEDFGCAETLVKARLSSIRTFLSDYEAGKAQGRYIFSSVPNLPFGHDYFDVALCFHLLFLYDDMMNQDFHFRSLIAMAEAAREARVFPVVNREGNVSQMLDTNIQQLENASLECVLEPVTYRFQKGADTMLRINRR